MNFSWAVNMYDRDGDVYEECVLAFCGNNTILRFKNSQEMKEFANEMLRCLPELQDIFPGA